MPVQKEWIKPKLSLYGSVENITEQVVGSKEPGTGDSIVLIIGGTPVTIDVPGQKGSFVSL